jgi:hypothetical protein
LPPLTGSHWNNTRLHAIECAENEPLLAGDLFQRSMASTIATAKKCEVLAVNVAGFDIEAAMLTIYLLT